MLDNSKLIQASMVDKHETPETILNDSNKASIKQKNNVGERQSALVLLQEKKLVKAHVDVVSAFVSPQDSKVI